MYLLRSAVQIFNLDPWDSPFKYFEQIEMAIWEEINDTIHPLCKCLVQQKCNRIPCSGSVSSRWNKPSCHSVEKNLACSKPLNMPWCYNAAWLVDDVVITNMYTLHCAFNWHAILAQRKKLVKDALLYTNKKCIYYDYQIVQELHPWQWLRSYPHKSSIILQS